MSKKLDKGRLFNIALIVTHQKKLSSQISSPKDFVKSSQGNEYCEKFRCAAQEGS